MTAEQLYDFYIAKGYTPNISLLKLAEIFGVDRSTLYRQREAGNLPLEPTKPFGKASDIVRVSLFDACELLVANREDQPNVGKLRPGPKPKIAPRPKTPVEARA